MTPPRWHDLLIALGAAAAVVAVIGLLGVGALLMFAHWLVTHF